MAERKLNGRTFKVEPLLAVQALSLWTRIVKVLGPAWGAIREKMEASKKQTDTDMSVMVIQAVVDVATSNPSGEVTTLIKDIVETAMIKRPSGSYEVCDLDGDFTGHLPDIPAVAMFVLQENFADFFTGKNLSSSLTKSPAA